MRRWIWSVSWSESFDGQHDSSRDIPPQADKGYRWPVNKDGKVAPTKYKTPYTWERTGCLRAIPRDELFQRWHSFTLTSFQDTLKTTPGKMLAWTMQNFGGYQTDGLGGNPNANPPTVPTRTHHHGSARTKDRLLL